MWITYLNQETVNTLLEEIQNPDTAKLSERPNANALEHEAIYIFREVAAQFEKPVLLFSGGKDSITLVRLAQKAFWPAKKESNFDRRRPKRRAGRKEWTAAMVAAATNNKEVRYFLVDYSFILNAL